MSACGYGKKSCIHCKHFDINCLSGINEDNYIPATKEQVLDRVKTLQYISDDDRRAAADFLLQWYEYPNVKVFAVQFLGIVERLQRDIERIIKEEP